MQWAVDAVGRDGDSTGAQQQEDCGASSSNPRDSFHTERPMSFTNTRQGLVGVRVVVGGVLVREWICRVEGRSPEEKTVGKGARDGGSVWPGLASFGSSPSLPLWPVKVV